MSEMHPAAPHHLPKFLPGPDGGDPLFTVVVVSILIIIMAVGVMYFKLHALPERLGEKHNSAQLQLISVLAVLALFTHNNVFWVLALLIAVVRIPDFLTPLQTIANSLAKMSSQNGGAESLKETTTQQSQPTKSPPPAKAPAQRRESVQTEEGRE